MTSRDFANFMSALMSDVVEGKILPQVAYAACHAGGKLLRIVEMQFKYGVELKYPRLPEAKGTELSLADGTSGISEYKAKAS